jgi:hypothetical protein
LAGDIEDIGGFLGGEFFVDGDDRDTVTLEQFVYHLAQQVKDWLRKIDRLAGYAN